VLGSPVTWKGLAYLLVKFPLGILSFVVMVTAISLSASLIAAPLYYRWMPPTVNLLIINGNPLNSGWVIDTLPEALGLSVIGILVVFISLHAINGLAWVSGKFARVMLGSFSSVSSTPNLSAVSPATAAPSTPTETSQPAGSEKPEQSSGFGENS
jgi:hypothetical protein